MVEVLIPLYNMDSQIQDKFFSLLRFSIGTDDQGPTITYQELKKIHELSRKQSLQAVIFSGVKRLPKDAIITQPDEAVDRDTLFMNWIGECVMIARQNMKADENIAGLFHRLGDKGFECCLLKGEGNAQLYPNPLDRTCGDIDVWIRPKRNERDGSVRQQKEDVKAVINFAKTAGKSFKAIYHHIDFPAYHGTDVELHYRPHFMQSLWYNARLQRYFREHADEQFRHKISIGGNEIAVPTQAFNIVFQLSHIYQHLFKEGIGLRQILDYYFLLTSADKLTDTRKSYTELLDYLGLKSIASAICWILVYRLGMNEDYCVVEPGERHGRFVLHEILAGGNFGRYDERRHFGKSKLGKNMERLLRDARLISYFPNEALSEPVFRVYHAIWRKING